MTFEQLLYVEVLSHYNSLQTAADVLHISKSGLSLSISQLEEELNVKIFERTSRGTVVTRSGLQMLSAISKTLQAKSNLEKLAVTMADPRNNENIHIEYVNTMLKPFINVFLRNYETEFSNVFLNIISNDTHSIIRRVRNNDIDAGFIAVGANDEELIKDLAFRSVHRSKMILVTSKENEISRNKAVTLEDLKKQKFCLYNDPYHDYIFDRLQFLCGPLKLVLKTDDSWTVNKVITELNAVGFGRSLQWKLSRESISDDLVAVRIGHLINDDVMFGWVLNPRVKPLKSLELLINFVTEDIKKECHL